MVRVFMFVLAAVVAMFACSPTYAEDTAPKSHGIGSIFDSALDFMEEPVVFDGTSVKAFLHVDVRLKLDHVSQGDNGVFGIGQDSDTFYKSRVIIGLDFEIGKLISAGVEAIDARAGSYPDPVKPSSIEDSFDLNRVWINLHPESIPLFFKIARDYIDISDGRLIGHSDWDQVPWRFEQFMIGFKHESSLYVNIAYARPVFPDDDNFDQAHYRENTDIDEYQYGLLWGGYSFMPEFSMDLFFIMKTDDNELVFSETSEQGDHRVYTYGIRGFGKIGDFAYSADLVFQGGNYSSDDIKAFSTEAWLRYEPDRRFNPKIWVGYTFASGDKNDSDGKHETFDPLFGNLGDRYSLIGAVSPQNVNWINVGASANPVDEVLVSLNYWYYRRLETNDGWYAWGSNIYNSGPFLTGPFDSRTLGHEINVKVDYNFTKFTTLTVAYASFFQSDMLQDQNKKENADYFYIEFRLKF
ncbi:MAG: hypothetical protein Kow00107_11050 [Planctomycetota bacterium]